MQTPDQPVSTMTAAAAPRMSAGAAILTGGLLGGTGDIVYAILWLSMKQITPLWVLQSVASGYYGADAFKGGWTTGLVGLASHYCIVMAASAIYYLASRRLRFLTARPWVFGALYGVAIYLFMNFVVLPLSAFPLTLHYPMDVLLRGFVSHAVLVGMPIAWCISRTDHA